MTAGSLAPALAAHLTRCWNSRVYDSDTRFNMAHAQIMLVVAGAKPAATSLRGRAGNWAKVSRTTYDLLRGAGYAVRVIDVGDREPTAVVARDTGSADAVEDALYEWETVRDRPGERASNSTRLGRALGYPEGAIKAFAGSHGGDGLLEEDDLPWDGETVAWWDVVGCFRLPADAGGLAEARAWALDAIARLCEAFPGIRPPHAGPWSSDLREVAALMRRRVE